jgi:Cu(I)/Ag(I) efflux system membrane fusion protein
MNRPNIIRTVVTGVAASAVTYTLISYPIFRPASAQAATPTADQTSDHNQATHSTGPAVTAKGQPETKFVTKYTCPMHPQIIEDHPGNCPICGMTLVPKLFPVSVKPTAAETVTQQAAPQEQSSVDHSTHDHAALPSGTTASAKAGVETKFVTKYTCPMHPQIIEDHPGTCPICGMTLVPKLFPVGTKDLAGKTAAQPAVAASTPTEAGAAMTMPAVAVAPLTLKYMNVVLAPVQWRNLTRQIHSVGLVGFDENRITHVHPRASGWVETLKVRALGDTVKKGEVLLTVYSPDILAAEKDFLVASRSGMPTMRDAARERLSLLSVPESVIKQISATGQVARTIPIVAPQSGYIAAINLREGMYITPALDLYTIADPAKVWVQAEILERDMQQVAVGQPAEMTVDGIPGRIWHGKVDFVYPELDAKSRTLKARLVFDNPDGELKPNQFAEIGISGVSQGDVLTVPSTAVIPTAQGARVVRKNADGTFQPVLVQLGASGGGYTQITHGLSPNDEVVASGQFLIDSESNIQSAFARMTGAVELPSAPAAAPTAHQQGH